MIFSLPIRTKKIYRVYKELYQRPDARSRKEAAAGQGEQGTIHIKFWIFTERDDRILPSRSE
jgi:hypothetical protein